jgi:hypothetical protein
MYEKLVDSEVCREGDTDQFPIIAAALHGGYLACGQQVGDNTEARE